MTTLNFGKYTSNIKRGDFMTRILAVARVVVSNEYRVRFLCIRSSVDTNKARLMMSKVPYPCYKLQEVASLFCKDDMYFVDYALSDFNQLALLPVSQPQIKLKCSKIVSKDSFISLLSSYNPFLLQSSSLVLCNYFTYFACGWIYLNGTPLCLWKPSFRDKSIIEHFSIHDDVLAYSYEKDIYILTDENVRHKPAKLGEFLSINAKSLECVKYLRAIDNENVYRESTFIFDRNLREWVLLRESEPLAVLGRKDR